MCTPERAASNEGPHETTFEVGQMLRVVRGHVLLKKGQLVIVERIIRAEHESEWDVLIVRDIYDSATIGGAWRHNRFEPGERAQGEW